MSLLRYLQFRPEIQKKSFVSAKWNIRKQKHYDCKQNWQLRVWNNSVSTSTVLKKREYTQIRRISPQTKITSSQTKVITPQKKVIFLYRAKMTNMRLQSLWMIHYVLDWDTSSAVEMFCLVTLAFDLFDLFNSLSLAKSYIYHCVIWFWSHGHFWGHEV